MPKWLLLLSLSLLCQSVSAQSCQSLQTLDWMLGQWVANAGDSVVRESWRKVSPQTFEGQGETRSVVTNKLQSREQLRLIEMSAEVFYLAKVDHNTLPVAFALTQCSAELAVFENTAHDFPKKLEYQRSGPNALTVTVSGEGNSFKLDFIRSGEH